MNFDRMSRFTGASRIQPKERARAGRGNVRPAILQPGCESQASHVVRAALLPRASSRTEPHTMQPRATSRETRLSHRPRGPPGCVEDLRRFAAPKEAEQPVCYHGLFEYIRQHANFERSGREGRTYIQTKTKSSEIPNASQKI
jgi:hypothetical protein